MPDNNTVERTIHPIALNRKNALFAGHDSGAENWAVIASLIETCKLNAVNPHAWATLTPLTDTVANNRTPDKEALTLLWMPPMTYTIAHGACSKHPAHAI
jgi:transposase